MLDQIGIWAILWSAQCLEPFLSIYLLGPGGDYPKCGLMSEY